MRRATSADFTVVRALLRGGRTYQGAVDTFQPYDRIQEVNQPAREALAEIARRTVDRKYEAYIFVNNRLEGFAPGTIEAVTERRLV